MPLYQTIAVYGVGLIGGSIGLALRQRNLAQQVIGIGRRESSLQKAQDCGAIDRWTLEVSEGVKEAEVVVVCSPVQYIAEHVLEVALHCSPEAIITDAGSTKAQIIDQVSKQTSVNNYIGSHPLAGSDKSGAENASANLFETATTVVTPTQNTPTALTDKAAQFWEALGSNVKLMDAAEHDLALAITSHLPHVIASVLSGSTDEKLLPLTATGWADTTRIAAGDVELWQQIINTNRLPLLSAIDNFQATLQTFKEAVKSGNDAQFTSILEQGKKNRDSVGS